MAASRYEKTSGDITIGNFLKPAFSGFFRPYLIRNALKSGLNPLHFASSNFIIVAIVESQADDPALHLRTLTFIPGLRRVFFALAIPTPNALLWVFDFLC